jgi:hypothetical protein
VTLAGTNLSGATQVFFGGHAATSVSVNAKGKVVAIVPAVTSVGPASVQVVTPHGTSPAFSGFSFVAVKKGKHHVATLRSTGRRRAGLALG